MSYKLTSNTWNWREELAILRVLASKNYTMGKEVRAFEDEFAAKMGTEHAVMVNSGSSANLVGLAALKYLYNYPEGSEVIVPAVSWSTTYFPITQLGFVPVFVDVNSNFNIETKLAKEAVTEKTIAILAVNLLGMPCELFNLRSFCKEKNIHLIEDNCESLGASINNHQTGTIGTFGTYSFFYSHHISTMEGGMIVTRDSLLADYMRSIRAHGWIRDARTNILQTLEEDSWKKKFTFALPGYCVRPGEMNAAIGREQLKKLDKLLETRKENAFLFSKLFQDFDIQTPKPGMKSSWFGFGFIFPGKRDILIRQLSENNIESRPIVTGNFLKQPCMKYIPHRTHGKMINADIIDSRGIMIGNNSMPLKRQLELTFSIVEKCL